MARMTQHSPDSGESAGYIKEERPLNHAVGRLTAGDVCVHLGKAGYQEFAPAINAKAAGRNLHLICRTYRHDLIAPDDDCLLGNGAFPVHRDDRDVYKGDNGVRGGNRCRKESKKKETGVRHRLNSGPQPLGLPARIPS
jgi:hypothetical protein